MKNYDPNIYRGIHTVRVTIQQWGYVGHIIQKISGNCKGRDVLDFDFEYEDADNENDCDLQFDEEFECFSAVLKNENGDTLEVEGDSSEFNRMIVAVEIIDFIKKKWKQRGSNP